MCYKLIQRFRVTGLLAGQYNTKLHGTITDVMYIFYLALFSFTCLASYKTVIQLNLPCTLYCGLRLTLCYFIQFLTGLVAQIYIADP